MKEDTRSSEEKYVDKHEKELYKRAVKYWGPGLQIEMMIEEASELIHALQKYKRHKDEDTTMHVCEEIADTQIMINQMALIFSKEDIKIWRYQKLRRLTEHIINYLGRSTG